MSRSSTVSSTSIPDSLPISMVMSVLAWEGGRAGPAGRAAPARRSARLANSDASSRSRRAASAVARRTRCRRRRSGRRACGAPTSSLVRYAKWMSSIVAEDAGHQTQAATRPGAGRSAVMSPVTTIRVPKPSRVRNIFICSGVVFWASSSTTNGVVERAAAHVRQRRDLDRAGRHELGHELGVHHLVAARRTAAAGTGRSCRSACRAGTRAAPRLHRRTGQDDAADLFALQAPARPSPSRDRSCRFRPDRCRTRSCALRSAST